MWQSLPRIQGLNCLHTMQYYIYEGQNLNDIHNERERDQEMAQAFR